MPVRVWRLKQPAVVREKALLETLGDLEWPLSVKAPVEIEYDPPIPLLRPSNHPEKTGTIFRGV